MADLDYILILVGSGLVAGAAGLGLAKFSSWIKDRTQRKRGEKFLRGLSKNEIKIDGETINLNKFILRDHDGKQLKIEIGVPVQPVQPQAQTIPQETIQEEKPHDYKRLLDYR